MHTVVAADTDLTSGQVGIGSNTPGLVGHFTNMAT